MKRVLLGTLAAFALIVAQFPVEGRASASSFTSSGRVPATSGFVTACGNRLCANSQPFRFVGATFYDAAGNPNGYFCGPIGSNMDSYLNSMFRSLHYESGATVLRFWAFQSYTNGGTDWSGFDRVIAYAKKWGFRLIFTLENQWNECTQGGYKYDSWYSSGYRYPYGSYSLSYRQYVGEVVQRYANDPTVLAWMLLNGAESKSPDGTSDPVALYNFAQDMSSYIHSLDPNHLVVLGTIGTGQPGTDGSNYMHLYSLPYLTLADGQDFGNATEPLPGAPITDPTTCYNSIACSLAQSTQLLNKPFIITEAGIPAGPGYGYTTLQRAALFGAKINAMWQAGGSGYLIWDWTPTSDAGYDFDPADPLNLVLNRYH